MTRKVDPSVSTVCESSGPAGGAPGCVVDLEKGEIRGGLVIGNSGESDRYYPPAVLAEMAAAYNAYSFFGHQMDPKTREPIEPDPAKRMGKWHSVAPDAQGQLRGTWRAFKGNAYARQFLEAVAEDPGAYSFSPQHRVRWANGGRPNAQGKRVAEKVLDVKSVDAVCYGGTTTTVFESFDPAPADPANPPTPENPAMDPKAIAEALADPAKAEAFVKALQAAMADADAEVKLKLTEAMMSLTMPAAPADPATATVAESLAPLLALPGRFGKAAKAVGDKLSGYVAAEKRADDVKWAKEQFESAGIAEPSDVAVELVAESRGNADRVAKLVGEFKPAGTGGRTGPPKTGGRGGNQPMTAREVADAIAAGKL